MHPSFKFTIVEILAFLLLGHVTFCQTIENIDSLKITLEKENTDTGTISRYLLKLKKLKNEDIVSKEVIANWIIKNCEKKEKENLLIQTLETQGRSFIETGDYTKAAELYNKAMAIGTDANYYEIKCDVLLGLAEVFYHTEQFDKEKEYDRKSFDLAQKNNYKKGIGNAQLSIAGDLLDADMQTSKDTANLVFKTLRECLGLWIDLKDTNRIILTKIRMGEYYAEYTHFDSALVSIKDAERYLSNFNYEDLDYYYFIVGKIYHQKGVNTNNRSDFIEAITYFRKCLPLAIKQKNKKREAWCYDWLSNTYKRIGNYEQAYTYLEKHSYLYGSIVSEDNFKELAKVEHRYEVAKKEKEIISLNAANQQKSTLNKVLISSAAALLLIGFIGYKNFRTKQKLQQIQINELEKDKQLLAIDAMLKGQEEERSRIAKDLHDGLGGMLSGVKLSFVNMKESMIMDADSVISFENSIKQLDSTITELRKVAHNLMPEALVKFGLNKAAADFCNAMQLASKINIIFEPMGVERQLGNTADLYVYRIIQELINNALKHAAPSQILVQLTKTADKVLLTVEDDGKGFNKDLLQSAKGIGMKNLQQRVDYFKGKMELVTGEGEGTSVNIELIA